MIHVLHTVPMYYTSDLRSCDSIGRVGAWLYTCKNTHVCVLHKTLQRSATPIADVFITNSSSGQTLSQHHLPLTCFLSRETHLDSIAPRLKLGSIWFRTFARKTCKQWKTHPSITAYFQTSKRSLKDISIYFSIYPLTICLVLQRDMEMPACTV